MNKFDDEQKNQELTEEQQKLLKQIEQANSEEELLELIEKLKIESENASVKITPIRVNSKKTTILKLVINCLVTLLALFGLIGIMKPFTTIFSSFGLIIYLGLVILIQVALSILLSFSKNPYVLIFKGIILGIIMIGIMCIIPIFLKNFLMTNYNTLFVVALLTYIFKTLILKTINKLLRG